MKVLAFILLMFLCTVSFAGDVIIRKTDARGREILGENYYILHEDGTITRHHPDGRIDHSQGGFKVTPKEKVDPTDAYNKQQAEANKKFYTPK